MKGEGKIPDHSRGIWSQKLQACQGCLQEGGCASSTLTLRAIFTSMAVGAQGSINRHGKLPL